MLVSILINGLISGGVYAILAIGFSLIFGVAKILNMAHTAFYMVTAFIIIAAIGFFEEVPLPVIAVMSIFITGLLGVICYKLCFDRVKVHETAVMIISVAVAMLIEETLLLTFGGQYQRVPPFVDGFFEVGEVRVLNQHFFTAGSSIITLIGVWFLLAKTKLGKAIRAVDQDHEIANVMGIDVSKTSMQVMGISAILAGLAGAVTAPSIMVNPLMWVNPLVIVLSAVVLGGLGSIKGSAIAAFILGYAETLVVFLVPDGSFLRGAVSLTAMVLVLLVRPEGLFGVAFEEERL
jgi:branched-chain amino acid transport system permease protein